MTAPDGGYYAKRPRGDAEALVAAAFSEALGVDSVQGSDDFFVLGGGPQEVSWVAASLSRSFSVTVTAETVRRHSTPNTLGSHLRTLQTRSGGHLDCLLVTQGNDHEEGNLFYFHSASGNALAIGRMRGALPCRPVGVRAAGLLGEREIPRTVEGLADVYFPQVRTLQPEGPYHLSGFSAGGLIALEVAHRLRAAGQDVALLAMFDTDPPGVTFPDRLADPLEDAQALKRGRLGELLRRVGRSDVPSDDPADPRVVEALRQGNALAPDMGAEALDRQLEVFVRVARAIERYSPPPYTGMAHLFTAEADTASVEKWHAYAPKLQHIHVGGEHYEYQMFSNDIVVNTLKSILQPSSPR
ncbi:thioesterase domain-containing protein [Streptomyces sp. NPDC000345]|uniref:thioesterase domain-containing protein n=1 Tax=Streptomyces sp. NPDC000345 TaxID=3364537 RepID=UPI0036963A94